MDNLNKRNDGIVYDGDLHLWEETQDKELASAILKLFKELIKKHENKYPMTGKPDKDAAYKNGWYDCAFSLRAELCKKVGERYERTL
jgi:rhamnogalacturonyl hydrolase YesR